MSGQSQVALEIFNGVGARVATLVDKVQGRGDYTVEFAPDHLAAGIYFYALKTEGFSETKKMLYVL